MNTKNTYHCVKKYVCFLKLLCNTVASPVVSIRKKSNFATDLQNVVDNLVDLNPSRFQFTLKRNDSSLTL
jgi:hypothetical protein